MARLSTCSGHGCRRSTATGARVVWREAVEVAVHPRRCEVLEALEGDAGLGRVHWILGTTEAGQEACLVNEPSFREVVGQFLDAAALLDLLLVEDDAHAVFGHADHDLRTALEEHPGRNLLVNADGGDLRLGRDVNLVRQRHLGLSGLFLAGHANDEFTRAFNNLSVGKPDGTPSGNLGCKDHLVAGLLSGVGDVELLRPALQGEVRGVRTGEGVHQSAEGAARSLALDGGCSIGHVHSELVSFVDDGVGAKEAKGAGLAGRFGHVQRKRCAESGVGIDVHVGAHRQRTRVGQPADDLISSDQGGAHGVRRYGRVF